MGAIGFEAGQGVLAAAHLFLETSRDSAVLHVLALARHPMSKAEIARVYPAGHPLGSLAVELIDNYPDLIPGAHRLELAGGRVVLTLVFGDLSALLQGVRGQVQAWFIDDVFPPGNPHAWPSEMLRCMAMMSAPDATFAACNPTQALRDGLTAAGFACSVRPDFSGKGEMLVGQLVRPFSEPSRTPWFPHGEPSRVQRAVVIGAGIAGASVARRLAERGWSVRVLERHDQPAQEASGNHAGILLPVLSAEWNALSRLTSLGLGYARRMLDRMAVDHPEIDWHPTGVLRLARNPRHAEQQRKIAARLELPEDFARWVGAEEGSALIGARVEQEGWWFAGGGWVNPPSLVRALLDHPGIALTTGVLAARLERIDNSWHVFDASGRCVETCETLILANADAVNELLPGALPLAPVRGQISLAPVTPEHRLKAVACREGYVIPERGGMLCFGASFAHGVHDPAPRMEDHAGNIERLTSILPDWDDLSAEGLAGRVSHRCATPDRLPIAGPLHDAGAFRQDFEGIHLGWPAHRFDKARLHPGLWVSTGHGARGLVWTALLAELIASQLNGDPLPLTDDLVQALHPARFDYRQMRSAPEHRQAWSVTGEDL